MNKEQIIEAVEIINDTEDLLSGGWRKKHQPVQITMPAPRAAAAVTEEKSADSIESINTEIFQCRACDLCSQRKTAVPGAGVLHPSVMFIGEGPGAEEDKTGIPFVGRAGQYLDKWLAAINLDRQKDCFIGNIIKCRPPGNRDPQPDEIEACKSFLVRQLAIIQPVMIITLGRFAAQFICNSQEGIGRLRGKIHTYQGIPVVPTYHPSAVLRNPDLRKDVWDDLKRAKVLLDERRDQN